tara:strand:+ start:303 stop:1094 length:792 start_codon:yes stop_codon:yes gene_type:complete
MEVEQIYTENDYRNFNYLIACSETGDALAIDPLDHKKCLTAADKLGWNIVKILNTHEHGDHIGGNAEMVKSTGAQILAHANAKSKIPNMDVGLKAGDIIKVGKTVELECLDTPGHTMSHVCVLSHTDIPALFSGDTLFNAGAGNCHNGGHPEELYETFVKQLDNLPDTTRLYPGHDYLLNNLEFTIDREPQNTRAKQLLSQTEQQNPHEALITTLGLEKEVNTFFRLQSQSVINTLRESFPSLAENPSPKEVFLRLRELRNNW